MAAVLVPEASLREAVPETHNACRMMETTISPVVTAWGYRPRTAIRIDSVHSIGSRAG
jgi:hypothetical protein